MYIDSFNTTRVLITPPEKIELNEMETKKKEQDKTYVCKQRLSNFECTPEH